MFAKSVKNESIDFKFEFPYIEREYTENEIKEMSDNFENINVLSNIRLIDKQIRSSISIWNVISNIASNLKNIESIYNKK